MIQAFLQPSDIVLAAVAINFMLSFMLLFSLYRRRELNLSFLRLSFLLTLISALAATLGFLFSLFQWDETRDDKAWWGGPVEQGSGWLLHDPVTGYDSESSAEIVVRLCTLQRKEVLRF